MFAELLKTLARRLWPDFDLLKIQERFQLIIELSGVLFNLPWLILGISWLLAVTDPSVLYTYRYLSVGILFFSLILNRMPFFVLTSMGGEQTNYNGSNLTDIVLLCGIFILGPVAIWYVVLSAGLLYTYIFIRGVRISAITRFQFWNWLRNTLYNLGIPTFGLLCATWIYATLGGSYPLTGLEYSELIAAILSFFIYWSILIIMLIGSWAIILRSTMMKDLTGSGPSIVALEDNLGERIERARQALIFFSVTSLPGIFGIFGALLYARLGVGALLVFFLALILVSWLAHRTSEAVVISQQKSNQLDKLEKLGRAIITSPVEGSELPYLLEQYVPKMVTYQHIEIRIYNDQSSIPSTNTAESTTLLQIPATHSPLNEELWDYFYDNPLPQEYNPGEKLPWTDLPNPHKCLLTPITSEDNQDTIGGIYLQQAQNLFTEIPMDLAPTMQVLAAQIASALHAANSYQQALELEKKTRELALAGEIQASILPSKIPEIVGWNVSTWLDSALETFGDFFDVLELPEDHWAIIIADVTDKGVGAALFMALTTTLLRTFMMEYPQDPAHVISLVNKRILKDSDAGLFITVFIGILDARNGKLTYVNAGHNPPILLKPDQFELSSKLERTGMAIGVMEDETWETRSRKIDPGESLVLFTDGIPDANNSFGELYGESRLVKVVKDNLNLPAQELQQAIISDLQDFVGEETQSDDITLLVVCRESK